MYQNEIFSILSHFETQYLCIRTKRSFKMIQNMLIKLDQVISIFGFAPDLKLRIAFGVLLVEAVVVASLFLYLVYVISFKKNLNYLKKEVL